MLRFIQASTRDQLTAALRAPLNIAAGMMWLSVLHVAVMAATAWLVEMVEGRLHLLPVRKIHSLIPGA